MAAGFAAAVLLAWWRGSGVLPGLRPQLVVAAAIAVPLAAAVVALLTTLRRTPIPPETAAIEADRCWGLRERLTSAIALQRAGGGACDPAVAAWIAAQAEGASRGRSAMQVIPDAGTRPLLIGAGLAVLAALLAWSASDLLTRSRTADSIAAPSPAAPPSPVRTLLASIEEELAPRDPTRDEPERPSASETEARTEARFAALEEEVARLAADPAAVDPRERFETAAELDAIAERLRQRAERSAEAQERLADSLRPLAPREMPPLAQGLTEALQRGDWEGAAEQLEALGGLDPQTREAVLRSIADAMEPAAMVPPADPAAGPTPQPADAARAEAPESSPPIDRPEEVPSPAEAVPAETAPPETAPVETAPPEDAPSDPKGTPDALRERLDTLRDALRRAIGEPQRDPSDQMTGDVADPTAGPDKKSSEKVEEPLRPDQTDAQSTTGDSQDLESDTKGGSTPPSETGQTIEGARDPKDRLAGQEEDRSTETREEKGADPSEVDGKGKPEHLRSPEEVRPLEDAASEEDPTNARKVLEYEGKGDRPRLEKGAAVSTFEEDDAAQRPAGNEAVPSPDASGEPGVAAGDGVGDPGRPAPSAEELLREWAGEARDAARARRDARRLEELARRLAGGEPGSEPGTDLGPRDRALTNDRLPEPRPSGERPSLDLRRPDRPGAPPATPIASWLDTPAVPQEGAAEWLRRSPEAPSTLRATAERAIETGSVHPRHHRALQRYFARLEQAAEEGAPQR